MPSKDERTQHTFEVVNIPRSYIESDIVSKQNQKQVWDSKKVNHVFGRFLNTLLYANIKTGFRIETDHGNARILYLLPNQKSSPPMFETIYRAHFQDFEIQPSENTLQIDVEDNVHVCIVKGVPQNTERSLDTLTEIMTKFSGHAFYQVLALPAKPGRINRYAAKHKLKSALEKSQRQQTEQGWLGKETRPRIDVDSLLDSEDLKKQYERLSTDRVFKCQVTLAFWGRQDSEAHLKAAVTALIGSISSIKKKTRLKTRYVSGSLAGKVAQRTIDLKRKRITTEMTATEAIPLFELPHNEIGIEASTQASFSSVGTSKQPIQREHVGVLKQNEIALGSLYRFSSLDKSRVKYLPLQDLRKHTLIVGKTGTGKSTTKNRLVIDAWRNGVPSLMLEPAKTDARILMGAIPELRVFTIGKETVTPFRTNPFHVEEGVSIQLHINLLYTCFVAGWPVYGILSNHVRRVLNQTYVNNGWDPLNEVRGKPITLEMFREEVERYCESHLSYGSELSQDFRGPLLARAEDLCDSSRAAIFNTIENLPMDEFLSVPSIVELDHLGDSEFVSFVLSLLLVRVYEYFRTLGPSSTLRNLLVIDEAHRVVEELPKTLDMSEGTVSKRHAIDQLVNLISEARSLGLGVILAEQIPTRLARDAIKNCHNIFIHKLTSPEDLELMARETGCNREQAEHIAYLKDGEAIVRGASDSAPFDVQVHYDPDDYPDMLKSWTDAYVRERMRSFYLAHPGFAKTPKIPDLNSRSILHENSQEEITHLAVQVEDIVQTTTFRDIYLESIAEDETNPLGRKLEDIIAHYAVHLLHLPKPPTELAVMLLETTMIDYGPPLVQPDMDLISQLVAEKLKDPEHRRRRG